MTLKHQNTVQERTLPHEVLDGVWMWSVFSEEKGVYFNGFALVTPKGLLIVDPPSASAEIFEALLQIAPPFMIFITNRDHERESSAFRHRFQVPTMVHALDGPLLETSPDIVYNDGDRLPGEFKVIHLPSQKSPGESALYQKERGLLLVGDALISHPANELSMLPDDKYKSSEEAYERLKILADLHPGMEAILAGDGEPILSGAQDLLEAFFLKYAPNG